MSRGHSSRRPALPAQPASPVLAALGFPLLAVAGCAAITALRVFPLLAHPALGWDERVIFSAFYSGKGGIFYLYPDYISLLQNAIFVLAFKLFPLAAIPAVLCYTAFAISTCGLALLSLPVFRGIIRSDAARAATCLLLAALPLGNAALATAPAYQNWTCLAVNGLIGAAWMASYRSGAWRIPTALVVVAGVSTLSQPLSICFTPLYAVVIWRATSLRDIRTQIIALLLSVLSVTAAAEAFTLGRDAAHAATIPYGHLVASAARAIPFALDRGFLESFIGAHWRGVLIDDLPPAAPAMAPLALYLAGALVLAGLLGAYWLTRDPKVRGFVAASLFTEFCLAVLVLTALEVARPGFSSGMLTGLSRYWFAQHVMTIVAVCALVFPGLLRGSDGAKIGAPGFDGGLRDDRAESATGENPRSPRRAAAASLVGALLTLWLVFANIGQSTQYGGTSGLGDGAKLAARQEAFLLWVSASEASGDTGCREQGPEEPEPRLRLVLPKERDAGAGPCLIFPP